MGLETAISQLQQGETVTQDDASATFSHAAIIAPIIHSETWQGSVICYADAPTRRWLPVEIEAVTIFAQLLSAAFGNVRSYEQTQQQLFKTTEQLQEAETLNEIAARLNSALELDEVLQQTVDVLRRYLSNVQSCSLSILEDSGKVIRLRAQWLEEPILSLIHI